VPRDVDSIKRKLTSLKAVRKPTGAPDCPPDVRRAKRLQAAIESAAAVLPMCTGLSDDDASMASSAEVTTELADAAPGVSISAMLSRESQLDDGDTDTESAPTPPHPELAAFAQALVRTNIDDISDGTVPIWPILRIRKYLALLLDEVSSRPSQAISRPQFQTTVHPPSAQFGSQPPRGC